MLTFLRKNTKSIMIAVAVVFIGSMFYGLGASRFGSQGGKSSNDIAKVNGKKIDPLLYQQMFNRLLGQFGKNLQPQEMIFVENMALGQSVDFMLVLSEAKGKVSVSGQEMDAVVANLMKNQNIPSQKDLEAALKRSGMSFSNFKDMLKDEMLVQKMVQKIRQDVKMTPADLRQIRASHILVTTEVQAKAVEKMIGQGQDFGQLAKQYSADLGTAQKGGDLGYFTTGMMVPAFEDAAFSLKVGEVSKIVKSPFGFHIIKLTDTRLRKTPAAGQNLEASILAQKQQTAFQNWFMKLKQNAKVEIISPELKAADYRFKGKLAEAAAEYKKAIAQNPNNAFLHIFLADTYLALNQKELALLEYDEALRAQGNNFEFYIVIAKAFNRAGSSQKAIEVLSKASMLAADSIEMHQTLLKEFQAMKASKQAAIESAEIARIVKKEKFEKSLQAN